MTYNILPSSGRPVQRTQVFKPAHIDLKRASPSTSVRTIPELIEYNARANPNALYCVQALKSRDGQTRNASQLTMRQLHGAIWQCSNNLRGCFIGLDDSTTSTSDRAHVKPDPVALLMDSDMGLLIHLFSLLALGVPAILLSPRLNPASIQHLLTTLRAQAVLTSPRHVDTVKAAFETTRLEYGRGGTRVQVAKPFTDYLSGSREEKAIPADATIWGPRHFLGDSDNNVIILHTSGTTGFPKPVHQPHKMLLGYACCHRRTEAEDVEGLNLSMLPLYHGFGLVVACLALGIGKPILLPPPHEVSTARSSVKLLQDYSAKSFTTVPFILEEISKLPDDQGIAHLTALQYVACGGGPLGVAVGDHLVEKGVRLLNHFGSTETGPLGPFMVPRNGYDWHYWPLRSDVDVKIEPCDTDEANGQQHYQLTVTPFGWSEPFVLQDRFEKDSRSETPAFRAVGREDDVLVLINGMKVQPKILESTVSNSDLVRSALAFGEGKFEIGLLLEPAQPPKDVRKFKLSVWPLVQEACQKMDSHAQISSMANLVVLDLGESLPRSDKGSVLRKEAYREYKGIISQVYSSQSVEEGTEIAVKPGADHLEDALSAMIREELRIPKSLTPDDDFFDWGVNSLQVVRIKRGLISVVKGSQGLLPKEKVTTDLVYRNPTINKLCQALRQNTLTTIHGEETLMKDYISRFSLSQEQKGFTVLLTGSSGSLGSYLLSHLASLPQVAEVICFVRSPSHCNDSTVSLMEQRIEAAEEKGATITSDKRVKVAVVEGDPAAAQFGLPSNGYEELCKNVTHIMHAAWPVDFQRPLESFESQFGFLQNLLQLARDTHVRRPLLKPRLLFVSSIAVVGQYPTIHGSNIAPEEAVTDLRCTSSLGYGKAKLVCERILAKAAEDWASEMEVSSVRTGQLSGAEGSGYWNPKEHFPALIKMSHEAGVFPRLKGTLSWLPVNVAAAAMSDLLLSSDPMDLIYHMENPVRQDWATVMNQVAKELGHRVPYFVELEEWTSLVRQSSSAGRDSGIEMLMHFLENEFQHMSDGSIVLDIRKTRRVSKSLRDVRSISVETITKYIGAWKRAGLIL